MLPITAACLVLSLLVTGVAYAHRRSTRDQLATYTQTLSGVSRRAYRVSFDTFETHHHALNQASVLWLVCLSVVLAMQIVLEVS